jgi:hypothetical protein
LECCTPLWIWRPIVRIFIVPAIAHPLLNVKTGEILIVNLLFELVVNIPAIADIDVSNRENHVIDFRNNPVVANPKANITSQFTGQWFAWR